MASGKHIAKNQRMSRVQVVYFDNEPVGVTLPMTAIRLHIGVIVEKDGVLYEVWYQEDDGRVTNYRAERKLTAEEFFAEETK